jgi:hypothetical protein
MRILLRQAGLRRTDDATAESAVLARTLHGDLPKPPAWLHVSTGKDAEA